MSLLIEDQRGLLRLRLFRYWIGHTGKLLLSLFGHSRKGTVVFLYLLNLTKIPFVVPPFCCNSFDHDCLARSIMAVVVVNLEPERVAAVFDNFLDGTGELSKMLLFKILEDNLDNVLEVLVFSINLLILMKLVGNVFANKGFVCCL